MEIGPHLLGRVPSVPDSQDWAIGPFLAASDPLDTALAAVLAAHGVARTTKAWIAAATPRIKAVSPPVAPPAPAPPPVPSPATGDSFWADMLQLDQANTGHCVGFGWAQYGNTDPVNDNYLDDDGHAIYYAAKVIDGEPKQENGSSVRSGALAMRGMDRIDAFAFASSTDEITAWVQQKGPVVVGTDWYSSMFDAATDGTVTVSGTIEGGHCYLLLGVTHDGWYWFQNSWGDQWGFHGRFRVRVDDFASLLAAQGEACVAIELPLAAKLALAA